MELILALAIGVLTGSGVWLLLRPRTFQVIMGLSLLSYAVNLFIFSMGRLGLAIDKEPVLQPGIPQDLAHYADPMPQALTLCHDGAVSGGPAGLSRHGGYRSCGRHARQGSLT